MIPRKPLRACLDNPMDPSGGRIVVVADYLTTARITRREFEDALAAMNARRPYLAPNGAWSLTPID